MSSLPISLWFTSEDTEGKGVGSGRRDMIDCQIQVNGVAVGSSRLKRIYFVRQLPG